MLFVHSRDTGDIARSRVAESTCADDAEQVIESFDAYNEMMRKLAKQRITHR